MVINYRLGLDLGTNSLGWAVIELDDAKTPLRIERIGSRIFPSGRHPKDDSSLAVQRRGPRQMRRRRDRYLRRRERFIHELVAASLFPAEKAQQQALVTLNPYRLRAEGLSRELTLFELGRALFHLQQRRGFKSNRKTDKTSADPEKETSKLKIAIREFAGDLDGATVGAELWRRIQNGEPARARLNGSGPNATYTFYVGRDMVEHEFDALWDAQRTYHPELSGEARAALKQTLLFQRDLLPQDVGKCFFERTDDRAPMALPSSQRFRLYQEVNHLRVRNLNTQEERSLTRQERDAVAGHLATRNEATFDAIRKAAFGRDRSWQFSIEDQRRTKLKGDQVTARLSNDKALGDAWFTLAPDRHDAIVERLLDDDNELALIEWLQAEFELDEEHAQYISDLTLPPGHLRIGRKAISKILPQLIEGWNHEFDHALTYDQAVAEAGYRSHSQTHGGTMHDLLPYYGEILYRYTMPAEKATGEEKTFGKIGNPTVHIGLNQVRKVVNALIAKYGLPTQVIVEVARELKQSQEAKREIKGQQKKNQDENDRLRKQLAELGQTDNFDNRLKLRLFLELRGVPKRCVYTGRAITIEGLFNGNDFQIDHILPLSKTLDDGYANKVLVHNSANRYKKNQSPFEAFGSSPDGYTWDEILERAKAALPQNKQRRFSPEAMAEAGAQKDFLARQLNDTAYLARVSKQYLEAVCTDVWVTPGRLTGLLRGKWNLNSILSDSGKKERTDHRHHAIDAAVIAVTDRSLLNGVSRVAALAEDRDLDRKFDGFPDPWPDFRTELIAAAQRVVISYKPDHGTGSRLHNDTAYGIVSGPDSSGKYRVRHRIDLVAVRQKHLDALEVGSDFRDEIEREILAATSEPEITRNLAQLAQRTGRRSVRFEETLSVVPIFARGQSALEGAEPYKAYKGDSNYCYEIFRGENGRWGGRIVSSFEANSNQYTSFRDSSRFRTTAWSGEPLVMRIMSDDLVAIEENETRRIMRVQRISEGQVALAGHLEGNVDARTRDKSSDYRMMYKTPSSLKGVKARRVFVDPIGNVLDPGFRD